MIYFVIIKEIIYVIYLEKCALLQQYGIEVHSHGIYFLGIPSETTLKGSATSQFNLIFMIVPKDEISQELDP